MWKQVTNMILYFRMFKNIIIYFSGEFFDGMFLKKKKNTNKSYRLSNWNTDNVRMPGKLVLVDAGAEGRGVGDCRHPSNL